MGKWGSARGRARLGGRAIRLALALAFVAGLAMVTGGGSALAAQNYVNTDVLNLRTDPSLSGGVITQMYQGERISVLDGPTGDGWYYVRYHGTDGWAWGGYLVVGGSAGWDGELGGVGGDTGGGPEKWIDVNRSSGVVTAFEGDTPVASYYASLGYDHSDQGFYATASGTYYIYGKNAALTWTEWGHAYIMYWMAFDSDRSNGFHSWSMDANGNVIPGGDGATGGCVALAPGDAAALFNWAPEGTRVEIHW